MAGLMNLVAQISQQQLFVTHDVPATHAAGAYNAFAITGGPVWIKAVLEYNDTIIAGATTTTLAVGAVGIDITGVPVSIQGAANTMVVSPLDVLVAKIAPALAVQMPSILGFATNIGVVASPGVNISVTFAGAAMGALENTSLYVVYMKLTPQSLIA